MVVLDSSAQGSPVVYGATQADITQEIVRLYDQAYPLKAGATGTGIRPARRSTGSRQNRQRRQRPAAP